MQDLNNEVGFPHVIDYTYIDDKPLLIMNILGYNLRDLKDKFNSSLCVHSSL